MVTFFRWNARDARLAEYCRAVAVLPELLKTLSSSISRTTTFVRLRTLRGTYGEKWLLPNYIFRSAHA
jgi:hypothetical protein